MEAKKASRDLLYEQAKEYITEHYRDKGLKASVIAEALGCSTRQLSRAFQGRKETLAVYILKARLYIGANLLRSQPDLSISAVARRMRFYDVKHFKRAFKKEFGHFPRQEQE